MDQQALLKHYNYDEFTPEKFMPWMRFDAGPSAGDRAPDFPLWDADTQDETTLSAIWSQHRFLIVEFGSFT